MAYNYLRIHLIIEKINPQCICFIMVTTFFQMVFKKLVFSSEWNKILLLPLRESLWLTSPLQGYA